MISPMSFAGRAAFVLTATSALSGFTAMSSAAEPVGWRNDGTGHFPNCQAVTTNWAESNVSWKQPLPGTSMSSPIAVGDWVFTLSEPTELICLNAKDGKVAWKRSHTYADVFPADKVREIEAQHAAAAKIKERIDQLQKQLNEITTRDPSSTEKQSIEAQLAELNKKFDEGTPYPPPQADGTGNTTGTPTSDGSNVYCSFATGIVSSHDLQGKRNWIRFVEKPSPRCTTSPLIAGDKVIVHLKKLIALNTSDGEVVWTAETPARLGTAVFARVGTKDCLVTPAGSVVQLTDGKVLAEKLFEMAYCSPIVHNDVVYALERGAVKAIQLNSQEESKVGAKTLWETRSAEDDRLASPVLHDGLLYCLSGKGILEVLDAKSGERVYRKRLDLNNGRADGSLCLAGTHLFASSTSGRVIAFKPGREYEEVASSDMEGFSSSPFFSAGHIYVRAPKHLYCVGKLSAKAGK